MDNNKSIFLTYSDFSNSFQMSFNIDHKNLTPKEIQQAIDEYIISEQGNRKEIKRLSKLVDELANENKVLERYFNLKGRKKPC